MEYTIKVIIYIYVLLTDFIVNFSLNITHVKWNSHAM
jgi:hypothetical protein